MCSCAVKKLLTLVLAPRMIREQLTLKMLISQHSKILIRITPKINDSQETLLAIEQVVSFVVTSVVTLGFTKRIEVVSLQRLEEIKILSLQEILPGVPIIPFEDAASVLISIALIQMLVSIYCDAVVVCALVRPAAVMTVKALILVVQRPYKTIRKKKGILIHRHCQIIPQM